MAGLGGLFHHPVVLAADPPLGGLLARAEALALPRAGSGVGRNVDSGGRGYFSVAEGRSVSQSSGMASSGGVVWGGDLDLHSRRARLQPAATGRPARTATSGPWPAPGDQRHPRAGKASVVPGALAGDVGVECGHWPGGVLRLDLVCHNHGRGDGSLRRRRTGSAIRRRVPRVSAAGSGSVAEAVKNSCIFPLTTSIP